jgi:type II secretory pathway pseudopilin PulG
MRSSMRARSGISLFEAVVALAIVGITAVSALAAVGSEMRTAEHARRAMVVESLATERQVFMWLLTDRDLLSLPDTVASGQFEYPMDEYQWTTESTPNATYAGLYDIRVTILWAEGSYSTSASQYRRPAVVTRAR